MKILTCDCGDDVYEDDRLSDTPKGMVACISCGTEYRIDELLDEDTEEIRETKI